MPSGLDKSEDQVCSTVCSSMSKTRIENPEWCSEVCGDEWWDNRPSKATPRHLFFLWNIISLPSNTNVPLCLKRRQRTLGKRDLKAFLDFLDKKKCYGHLGSSNSRFLGPTQGNSDWVGLWVLEIYIFNKCLRWFWCSPFEWELFDYSK